MIDRIKIQKLKIEYFEQGSGETLLFVHGAMGSFRFYQETLEELSKNYHVVAPTLPGMGKSQGKGLRSNFELYSQVTEDLIKKYKPKYAVGHSLGGAILTNVLSQNDYGVEKLMLVNSAGLKYDSFIYRTLRGWIGGYLEYVKGRKPKLFSQEIFPWEFRNMLLRRPFESLAIAEVLRKLHIPERFKHLGLETLILWGEKDSHIPLKKGNQINKLVPHSQFKLIKNAEHNWLGYDKTTFTKSAHEFFSE